MSNSIGMTEAQLERRERLLNTYNKPKRPVNEATRIRNENEYSTRKEYRTTNQAFGAVW